MEEKDGTDPQTPTQAAPTGVAETVLKPSKAPPAKDDPLEEASVSESTPLAGTVLVPATGKHPALTITGSGSLESLGMLDGDEHRPSVGLMLLPTGVAGLESWCLWLNFLDGMMTSRALAGGQYLELNALMRGAWWVSPFLYGTLKFWLFWIGLKTLERTAHKRDAHQLRVGILWVVLGLFSLVFAWHMWVLLRLH